MQFSPTGIVKEAWEMFKRRPWFLIGATVLSGTLMNVSSDIVTDLGKQSGSLGEVVAFCLTLMLSAFYGMGLIHFFLKAHHDVMSVGLWDLWYPAPFWNYLGAMLLLVGIIGAGLVLLVIPGFIFAVMFYFATYLVVDKGIGPIAALKESARITKGHRWDIFLLILLLILIVFAGLLCLVVGIFVSIPVSLLAIVSAYRRLGQAAR